MLVPVVCAIPAPQGLVPSVAFPPLSPRPGMQKRLQVQGHLEMGLQGGGSC